MCLVRNRDNVRCWVVLLIKVMNYVFGCIFAVQRLFWCILLFSACFAVIGWTALVLLLFAEQRLFCEGGRVSRQQKRRHAAPGIWHHMDIGGKGQTASGIDFGFYCIYFIFDCIVTVSLGLTYSACFAEFFWTQVAKDGLEVELIVWYWLYGHWEQRTEWKHGLPVDPEAQDGLQINQEAQDGLQVDPEAQDRLSSWSYGQWKKRMCRAGYEGSVYKSIVLV